MTKPWAWALALLVVLSAATAGSQTIERERDRAKTMLHEIRKDLEKYYYDPAFHGLDLAGRFGAAEQKLAGAESLGQIFGIVAQAVLDLNDSHTRFFPPERSQHFSYGWEMRMIGDDCYVTAVRPGSDAEKRGLKAGDKLLSLAGFPVNRGTLWKLRYLLYSVRPVAGLRVTAQSPGAEAREIDITTKASAERRVIDMSDPENFDFWELVRASERESKEEAHHYLELGDDVLIWQMPAFDLDDVTLETLIGKANKRKALVIDMRGNRGGLIKTLERLIGRTFPGDVRLGEVRERQGTTAWAVPLKGKPFSGKLVVLVDSDSASCSELFARAVQLEKRGIVLGDRTAGAVMRSRFKRYEMGADQKVFYSASISEGAILMSDGVSLEGRGVMPDEVILPSAQDLASGRDLALARALQLAGAEVPPEAAGRMFPIEWPK